MGNWVGALAVFVPLMTLILGLLKPLRRAVDRMAESYGVSSAERETAAIERLAEAEGHRADIAVRAAVLEDEAARERARLKAETAQFEVDAEAANRTLDAAVTARQAVIAARAEAEVSAAPEAVRRALVSDKTWLAAAYQAYCENTPSHVVPRDIGEWMRDNSGETPVFLT